MIADNEVTADMKPPGKGKKRGQKAPGFVDRIIKAAGPRDAETKVARCLEKYPDYRIEVQYPDGTWYVASNGKPGLTVKHGPRENQIRG